jgi:hypothetical protein
MSQSKWARTFQRDESGLGFLRRVVVVIVISIVLIGAATITGAQAGEQPQAFPLDDSPYGNTYGEWSARWWQWLTTIPAASNPNFDLTGANCAVGQVGPVWFLAGTFSSAPPKITRSCTIPHGKALLFTPLTQLDGAGAFDCDPSVPGVPCDLNALRALAAAAEDNPVKLEASLDGSPLAHLSDHRVQSPVFLITYPTGAIFGLPAGTNTPNLADGYWVLLSPLSPGKHTIHFEAVSSAASGSFAVDVTYNLTVQ